jgi:hypothetical protein
VIAGVVASIFGSPVDRAVKVLADATREREALAAELVTAASDFERTGSDTAAGKLAKVRLRLERAQRVEEGARHALARAERDAEVGALEERARAALKAEHDASAEEASTAGKLAGLVATAADLAADITSAIDASKASSSAVAARRDEARAAVDALRAIAPDRAAPLEAELAVRLTAAAARTHVRDRAQPLARLHAALTALVLLAAARVRELLAAHAVAAHAVGEHPLPPTATAQILDAALVAGNPPPDRVLRWLCLLLGTPSAGTPHWPSTLAVRGDDTDRAALREHAVSILWQHSERSPEAAAAIDRWLADTASGRDKRIAASHAEAIRASEAHDACERAKRWGGDSIVDVGRRRHDIAPMPGREHVANITPSGELVSPRDDAA